jgi:4a-hydroxytetrahydrobiopterin dehydratase
LQAFSAAQAGSSADVFSPPVGLSAEDGKTSTVTTDLASKTCIPCAGGVPPLKGESLERLKRGIEDGWRLVEEHHLEREYKFKNFRQALDFTNRVGELAEEQGHHPDIYLAWGRVRLTVWTHKIDGLTESDFIFAAKVDRL